METRTPLTKLFYDRKGVPIAGVFAWARMFDNDDYRIVIQTHISDETGVSTIWDGLSSPYHDPPLIFESLIQGGELDGHSERYATEEEACAGHERMCALAKAKLVGTWEG